jgi:hypothetical protein
MTIVPIRRAAGLVLLVLLLGVGCGPSAARPRVSGKVTFRGEPVGGQTLALFSEGGAKEFSSQKIAIDADGFFSGEVSAPGTYKVVIEESLAVQEGQKPASAVGKKVPQQLRSAATSKLEWPIQSGENYREFKLEELAP